MPQITMRRPTTRKIAREGLVARAIRGLLLGPVGKGMRRSRDQREAMRLGKARNAATQRTKIGSSVREIGVHPRAHLDLGAQKLTR